jgi:hypothetical protein
MSLSLSPFLSLNLVIFEYSCFALLENENFKFTSKAPSSPHYSEVKHPTIVPLEFWTGDVSHRNQEAYSLIAKSWVQVGQRLFTLAIVSPFFEVT